MIVTARYATTTGETLTDLIFLFPFFFLFSGGHRVVFSDDGTHFNRFRGDLWE